MVDAAAIIRAHRDYRKMKVGLTDINGSGVDLLRSTPEAKKNVLAAYYLRGKHTFRKHHSIINRDIYLTKESAGATFAPHSWRS